MSSVIPVVESTRLIEKTWRIVRVIKTYAGIHHQDVPFWGGDSMSLHAETAELALERARLLVRDTRGLIAVPQES